MRQAHLAAYPQPVPNYYLGYRVCGYSATGALPECWEVRILENSVAGPERVYDSPEHFGPRWAGETEALDRLILGIGSRVGDALVQLGADPATIPQTIQNLISHLYATLFVPAMPIQDAIDLAHFLAETAAKFAHFSMRATTIGGPIEIATITKHEGFKWVKRKHYFSSELNPGG